MLPELQKAIAEEGYEVSTPIQMNAIPPLLEGRDLLGCAQTGTGKTAAFTLPILQYLHNNKRKLSRGSPRVLVLAPTRELARQVEESVQTYGRHLKHINSVVIFGGVQQGPQVKALEKGVDIVVATPGRLLDLKQQGFLHLDKVEIFVLDEADRMLDMGFIPDIRKIIKALPRKRQSMFFSATMPKEVVGLSGNMLSDPVHVTIEPENPTVDNIAQKVMFLEKHNKRHLLMKLMQDDQLDKVLIFSNTKINAERVTGILRSGKIQSLSIHGDKSQSERLKALERFKKGEVRALVATDIAARGLDIEGISHVINYDIPEDPDVYIHRIGRTARAGAEGDAISFCCDEERETMRSIERLINKKIECDEAHRFHSEMVRNATGVAAKKMSGKGTTRMRSGSFGRMRKR